MEHLSEQCAEVQAALPLFVGGDLEPGELSAVEVHLTGCADCTALEKRARAARNVLLKRAEKEATGPVPSLWEGLRPRLQEAGLLAAAGPRPLAARPGRHTLGPLGRLGIGSAAAAAALVFALFLSDLTDPSLPEGGGGPGATADLLPIGGPTRVTPAVDLGRRGQGPTGQAGRLRWMGEEGQPKYSRAIEVLPDQGITIPTRAVQPSLVGGPRRLRPAQR